MSAIQDILSFNEQFVGNREYEKYLTDKFPDKKMVIVTCMDARLTELLPKALDLRNGDAKIIKNAGAIVTQPFGNIMRSILVAIYELGAKEVLVIGHYECGMTGLNPEATIQRMLESGVTDETIRTLRNSGMHLERWLTGFDNVQDSVERSVGIISNHPLLPSTAAVHGLIIHPETGKLDLVVDGYKALRTKHQG